MLRRAFTATAALLILTACGGDSGSGPLTPPAPTVDRVEVAIEVSSLYIGQTTQLSATVYDDQGSTMNVTVTWASSNTDVATVNASGLVTALAEGSVTFSASASGKTGSAGLEVQLIPAASVEVAPGSANLLTADTLQLTATVRDSAGTEIGGHAILWEVDDPEVATIDQDGRLASQGVGSVVVTASTSGKTDQASFEINLGMGGRVAELAVFDSVIPAILEDNILPGASFAVMKDGQLLMVRTYGLADTTTKAQVEPSSLFRYASLSKQLTAAAVMKLVEDGSVSLDDKIFTILDHLTPVPGDAPDPRLGDITLRHALSHTAGWHAAGDVDPLWFGRVVSDALGGPYPASPEMYARYWMGIPLEFDPGTSWSYGQIGYILAQLVIEEVTGQDYETFVQDAILTPAGTGGQLGRSEIAGKIPGEVTYYYPGIMPNNMAATGDVPAAYGWHDVEGNAAAAGWVGTAVDYIRFVAAIDGNDARPDVLGENAARQMYDRPLPFFEPYTCWYGLGWYSCGGWPNSVVYHGGNTWGTFNVVRRLENGVTLVFLSNGPVTPEQSTPVFIDVSNRLIAAAEGVELWPDHDLFPQF